MADLEIIDPHPAMLPLYVEAGHRFTAALAACEAAGVHYTDDPAAREAVATFAAITLRVRTPLGLRLPTLEEAVAAPYDVYERVTARYVEVVEREVVPPSLPN